MGGSLGHLKRHFPLQKCYPRLCLGVINEKHGPIRARPRRELAQSANGQLAGRADFANSRLGRALIGPCFR